MRSKIKGERRKLQFDRSKTAIAIALLLMFAMTVSLIALPPATAQSTMKSYAFINAVPNPVGINQETLFHVGITLALQSQEMGWEGLSVTITRPDGVTETISNIKTDSTGGTGRIYVPTMAGNYTLQTHFPQQTTTATKVGRFVPTGTVMLASDSPILTLIVQEEPISYYPGHPLPTEYWTRPIDPQIREWSVIAGNWLYYSPRNLYAPYNEGPETAHVLWAKPLTVGGLAGGSLGEPELEALGYKGFEYGDAYEGKWGPRGGGPIIMAGRLYYEKYAVADPYQETACVDMRTGEEIWSKKLLNNLTMSFGQMMLWDTYDFQGVYDYIWANGNAGTRTLLGLPSTAGNPMCAFDTVTGDFMYALYGLPSGTRVYGPKGEILIYTFDFTRGWMTLWNSTNIPALYASPEYNSMAWGQWRAMGKLVNATGLAGVTKGGAPYTAPSTPLGIAGYQWNKTIAGYLGTRAVPGSVTAILDDRIIGSSITSTQVYLWGLSLKSGQEGTLLFNTTWNAPAEWAAGNVSVSVGAISSQGEDGVLTLWAAELTKHYGFSAEDGTFLWETDSEHYLNTWVGTVRHIAYGRLISAGISGIVYAYDLKTGKTAWVYHATDAYSEILWNNDWWMRPVFITDGKIYCGHLEHSGNQPLPRGAPFICLNVTTGELIWRADGLLRLHYWGGGPAVIGDSTIVVRDTYDNRIYAVGKGPSATSVTAGPEVSVHGSSVLVKGMVTDISAGTDDFALKKRFPEGVPAVADENMSDWMLYVYKQFERPADAVGVEVAVSVLDPNNNYYEVGRTTSDASGFYSVAFTPEVPGKYTIYASFAGSGAYYGSSAETAINVEEAPAATPAPTPTPAPMTDTYILGSTVGIIIAIVVVGLLVVLLLRKRQ
jgi:hypothetical protein